MGSGTSNGSFPGGDDLFLLFMMLLDDEERRQEEELDEDDKEFNHDYWEEEDAEGDWGEDPNDEYEDFTD
jgi:hypothetical protein